MTFVPELAARPGDPWAHRKGEPRIFALLWAVFLMVAALLTVFGVRALPSPFANQGQFIYASRALLLIASGGATILWAGVRLSQDPPARPVRATLIDVLIILLPLGAIVWPLLLLTSWPWQIAAGLSLMLASWTILSGAIVATTLRRPTPAARTLSALAIAVFVLGAPALRVIGTWLRRPPLPEWWDLLSPLSAVYALTDSPSGLTPAMAGQEWALAAAPLLPAALLLLAWPRSPAPRAGPPAGPSTAD